MANRPVMKSRIRRLLILLLSIVLIYWAGRDTVRRAFGTWPAIHDPAQLVSDCEKLLQTIPSRSPTVTAADGAELPSSEWPPSIAALRPLNVTLYPDTVDIFISSGGIGTSLGYLVAPHGPNASVFHWYFKTSFYKRGIYFWESQT